MDVEQGHRSGEEAFPLLRPKPEQLELANFLVTGNEIRVGLFLGTGTGVGVVNLFPASYLFWL